MTTLDLVYRSISPWTVHDSVQPVSNGEHCAVGELLPDGGLDEGVCFKVHGSCGLIQNQDARLSEQGSSQAQELSLAHTGRTHTHARTR